MRGKLDYSAVYLHIYRITPAYAGKTASGLHKAKGGQDHPRVCGENKEAQAIKVLRTGSPPRMRGKRS